MRRQRRRHSPEVDVIYNSGLPNYVDLAIGNRESLLQDYDGFWRGYRLNIVWTTEVVPPEVVRSVVEVGRGQIHHFDVKKTRDWQRDGNEEWNQRVESFLSFVHESIEAGCHVRICDNSGRHRSGTAMALYLMVRTRQYFREIKRFIRRQRPSVNIRPDERFLTAAAQEFAEWRGQPW